MFRRTPSTLHQPILSDHTGWYSAESMAELKTKKTDQSVEKLGKHKTGKGCLYINKLEDVDQAVLKQLIAQSVRHLVRTNP